jgi:hypothetical protein
MKCLHNFMHEAKLPGVEFSVASCHPSESFGVCWAGDWLGGRALAYHTKVKLNWILEHFTYLTQDDQPTLSVCQALKQFWEQESLEIGPWELLDVGGTCNPNLH